MINRFPSYFLHFVALLLLFPCTVIFAEGSPLISKFSLEEKIGQLLMVHFHGEELNEDAETLIKEIHVGGIIYYQWANGLHSPEQTAKLSSGLQKLACEASHSIPLLIAVDQEGGAVNRLRKGFTVFPSNFALGLSENPEWGKKSAWMTGRELKAVGISLNFAPVADIYTLPKNPVIGIRSFESDPLKTTCWVKQCMEGYRDAGILSTLKHFPGHGEAACDSHQSLPFILKERDEIFKCELLPYISLVGEADAVMTGHLMFPSFDAENPVTFSNKIVEGLLRDELGFQGVVITDSLAMEGIRSQSSSVEEAVLRSLEAGHDIILLGGKQLLSTQQGMEFTVEDVRQIHRFLMNAVKDGRLSVERIDRSVERIMALKLKAGLFDKPIDEDIDLTSVGSEDSYLFARQIADRALHFVKGEEGLLLKISQGSVLAVAPESLKEALDQTSWGLSSSFCRIVYYKGNSPDLAAIQPILEAAAEVDSCIVFGYEAWKFPGQRSLFEALREKISFLVAIAAGNPVDEEVFDAADVLALTYSPVPCSLQAAFHVIFERR